MVKFHFHLVPIVLGLLSVTFAACDSGNGETSEDTSRTEMEMDADEEQMPSMVMPETPDDLDVSTTKETDEGLFRVTLSSELDPLALNQIHSWTVHIETITGVPVEDAEINLDGGMPQHDHGFPTAPEVTEEMGGGKYRIEGVKFNMAGWWEFQLAINTEDESDSVTFNVLLPQ